MEVEIEIVKVLEGKEEKEEGKEGKEVDEEEEGKALCESEAARLSQHSGPPAEEREGDAENALDDEEEGVSDEEEDEDAQEDAELAEGLVGELAEELVEDEQQPYEAGPAFVENGMQSGDDTVLLMYMEQDAQ